MTEPTPNPRTGKNKKIEIDEIIMGDVIKSVLEGTHIDQKLTLYSPFAAKLLVAAEESYPMAGKCTVAGYLLENAFPHTIYKPVWERVVKDIPETSRYGTSDIAETVKNIQLGADKEQLIKNVEERIKNKEVAAHITVHSPRLVAALKYLEQTTPKFKKGSKAAELLENEVVVQLGDPDNLEVLF